MYWLSGKLPATVTEEKIEGYQEQNERRCPEGASDDRRNVGVRFRVVRGVVGGLCVVGRANDIALVRYCGS